MKKSKAAIKVIFLSGIFLILFLFLFIPLAYHFLAKSSPIQSDILVAEGWMYDTMWDQTVREFLRKPYRLVIVMGDDNLAQRGKLKLMQRGIPEEKIDIASFPKENKYHHTFYSACDLKRLISIKYPEIMTFNLITGGAHGKKTHTILKRVLGSSYSIGIITCKSNNYNDRQLWKSLLGIKVTVRLFFGYLYALVWKSPCS